MKKAVLFSALLLFTLTQVWSQDVEIPQIGSQAPSFIAMSTNGKIDFPKDFGKSWKILFSHPKDFTPVCSSEILELARDQKDFDALNAKLIVLSTDLLDQHESWKTALEGVKTNDNDAVKIEFPIISDNDFAVSRLYGMIHNEESSSKNIRGVFFIDPDNKVRAIMFYPNEVGRNIEELKRTLTALEVTSDNKNVVTPADWKPGDDVLVPFISQEERENIDKPGSAYRQLTWFMVYKAFP